MWYSCSQNSAFDEQEVPDLVAAVVEDERAPVLVLALPRILVLEERRAVEPREAVRVLREVPGTQSSSTPMPARWHASTNALKSSGRAEAAGRRVERRSPGSPTIRETGAPSPAAARCA